jgi:hypothetical protein
MYQHLLLQDPPKFTPVGIFGLKMCHLATPVTITHFPAKNGNFIENQYSGFA